MDEKEKVVELRKRTGSGMLDCKIALQENEWNVDKSEGYLKAKNKYCR